VVAEVDERMTGIQKKARKMNVSSAANTLIVDATERFFA
jgi:hypothetical protein